MYRAEASREGAVEVVGVVEEGFFLLLFLYLPLLTGSPTSTSRPESHVPTTYDLRHTVESGWRADGSLRPRRDATPTSTEQRACRPTCVAGRQAACERRREKADSSPGQLLTVFRPTYTLRVSTFRLWGVVTNLAGARLRHRGGGHMEGRRYLVEGCARVVSAGSGPTTRLTTLPSRPELRGSLGAP
jgi:hypothetical protein